MPFVITLLAAGLAAFICVFTELPFSVNADKMFFAGFGFANFGLLGMLIEVEHGSVEGI